MRMLLHIFFGVMLAALMTGLGLASYIEYSHRLHLRKAATPPCGERGICPQAEPAPAARPGPLPALVLPRLDTLEVRLETPVSPPPASADREAEAPRDAEAADVALRPDASVDTAAAQEPPPLPLRGPEEASPLVVPPVTPPSTAPATPAQPAAGPQKTSPDRKTARPQPRRPSERRLATEDLVAPEPEPPRPARAASNGAPRPPAGVPSGAPLVLPGAVEPSGQAGPQPLTVPR